MWRSIKYEELYLHAYERVSQARTGIGRFIEFYNTRRPHSSLQARTPDVVYFDSVPRPSAEAAWPRRIHLKRFGICSDEWGQLWAMGGKFGLRW